MEPIKCFVELKGFKVQISSKKVFLTGGSWFWNSTHYKGWNFFSSTIYETSEEYICKALTKSGFNFPNIS
ncbi:MAG TPA: hypothetical protein DCK95_06140 [Anaerolineaceae bacterium]|nr:hypothetical protein [Anaerolineaceae bacterium]